jgi:cobalt-zinc-cadmium efflux system outer membrane protein
MAMPTARRVLCSLGLLLAGGCFGPVRDSTQAVLVERLSPRAEVDSGLVQVAARTVSQDPAVNAPPVASLLPERIAPRLAEVQQPKPPPEPPRERLKIPADLPGAQVPPLDFPLPDPSKRKERAEAIQRYFPDLSPLEAEPAVLPGPGGAPLTLPELERLALSNNPVVRQAGFDVEAARGAAIQAGLWPNPTVGFQGDDINTGNTAGYLGFFISQTIKTAGKPQLARASALIEVLNAELALRRAEMELLARVRAGYFAVIVARENMKVSRALADFADEVFRVQVDLLKAGQSPPYESLQLRVLSTQARAGFLRARNRYVAAWRLLASNLGFPEMPPTSVAGNAEMAPPHYDARIVLDYVLKNHTDVATAVNAVQKAQIDLKLARVTPIPDVSVSAVVQRDHTTAPFGDVLSFQLGVPIPIFDRHQGAIVSAEATLMRSEQESARVQNDLTARVAEAFERYDSNRRLVEYYRTGIMPDQTRAYRALYLRHHREPDQVNLQDVVNAQQILAQSMSAYLATQDALWTAVVDIANLLQTNELFDPSK